MTELFLGIASAFFAAALVGELGWPAPAVLPVGLAIFGALYGLLRLWRATE